MPLSAFMLNNITFYRTIIAGEPEFRSAVKKERVSKSNLTLQFFFVCLGGGEEIRVTPTTLYIFV